MKYEVVKGRRYAKLVAVHEHGGKSAVAFYDYTRDIWLNAASWQKPSKTLFHGAKTVNQIIDEYAATTA